VYPIVYFDALVVKVKESHQVRNKAADIAVGVDTDGDQACVGGADHRRCDVLGRGAGELRNRGVADVLIACYGGVTGLPGGDRGDMAAECGGDLCGALIRASMRFVSDNDRKAVAAALPPIYTAATEATAAQ
jgi:putative transposase